MGILKGVHMAVYPIRVGSHMAHCFIGEFMSQPNPIDDTVFLYEHLQGFIVQLVTDLRGSSTAKILAYLENHRQQQRFVRQDLLPSFVYMAMGGQNFERSIPLSAGWTLYLAAAHFLDDAQDNGNMEYANASAAALGLANMALVELQTDPDTLKDLLCAFGGVTILGANAQDNERSRGQIWSRTEYFQAITGKAATIISTGVWAGGRLSTCDPQILNVLKEFGLTWGMATQISDDCLDLAEDLANGLYTLPVIEGLSKTDHLEYQTLNTLLGKASLSSQEIQTVVNILDKMETVAVCKRMVRAYQSQAAAAFNVIPELATYFSSYVTLTP